MIKKLNIFIFKSFIGPLIITFFIALFVLLMQFLWLYIDELVGKGLTAWIILKLLFYASAHLVPMALPLAVLLASIMTFGNLGEHFELTAIKAAGISLQRIMVPLIIFSAFLTYGAFFFANNLQPKANLKFYTLLYDVKQQHPALNIKEGIFNNDIDRFSIKIGDKHSSKTMMYDFMIYDHSTQNGNNIVIIADSGTIKITDDAKYMVLNLYNGGKYEEIDEKDIKELEKKQFPMQQDNFEEQKIIFKLDMDFEESDESLFKHNYQMLNVAELSSSVDSLYNKLENKKVIFISGYLKLKILKNELKIISHDDTLKYGKRDSILNNMKIDEMYVMTDIDSLYNTYDKVTKQEVLLSAVQYAQTSQTDVIRSKEDIYQRKKFMAKHQVALHQKFTFAFACFIFFFIGAPLGAIIRKGGFGLPIIVSVLFFIAYYIITMIGVKFVKEGVWTPLVGLWGPSIILLPIGIFLTYKATTDSALLNIDSYIDSIKKFFDKKGKQNKKKSRQIIHEDINNQQ
jgi:lipopolysaccharide export system permease protein